MSKVVGQVHGYESHFDRRAAMVVQSFSLVCLLRWVVGMVVCQSDVAVGEKWVSLIMWARLGLFWAWAVTAWMIEFGTFTGWVEADMVWLQVGLLKLALGI